MKIFNFILSVLFSPFVLLFKANAKPSPNKNVKTLLVLLVSIIAVFALVLIMYHEVIFKWW